MKYKVLITTSGTGSRLGDLTRDKNKSVIEVAGKPAISYIIDSYSKETQFVITLGFYGNQVKTLLQKRYPEHSFKFINVDKYQGEGSSLGYSMLCAKDQLQCPFIFHACDTFVPGKAIPEPSENWIAGYEMEGNLDQYRTIQANEDQLITNINDKKEGNSKNVLIGLFGVKDYIKYWEVLESIYQNDPNDQTLNDTSPFNQMISDGFKIQLITFPTWHDTGNPGALEKTISSLNAIKS